MAQIQRMAALMEQVECVCVCWQMTGVRKRKLSSLTETIMNAKAMGTLDPMSHAFVNATSCEEVLSSALYQNS